MDVTLTEEQDMLREVAAGVASEIGPSTPHDLDALVDGAGWTLLANAGLLGLRVPGNRGGGGASAVEAMIVTEALARRLCPVPYLGTALALDLLLAAGANDDIVAAVAGGERRLTIALDETLCGLATLDRLDQAVAWDAAGADAALALDRSHGLVAVGVDDDPVDGVDLTREVRHLAPSDECRLGDLGMPLADDDLQRFHAFGLALLAADLVGAMEGTLAAAVEYSRGRVQFDTTIASFQAVQHLCAESYVLVEGARSATWHAAWAVEHRPTDLALLAARTAKAFAGENGTTVAETSIQVHGGVAITWEYPPHVFLRRILFDRASLGDEDVQLDAIAGQRLGGAA